MSDPIEFSSRRDEANGAAEPAAEPSNEVYARVGDLVLQDALRGVRRGMQPEEIVGGIIARHGVRLTRGELRLLLATRRRPGRDRHDPAPDPAGSATLTLVKPQPSDES